FPQERRRLASRASSSCELPSLSWRTGIGEAPTAISGDALDRLERRYFVLPWSCRLLTRRRLTRAVLLHPESRETVDQGDDRIDDVEEAVRQVLKGRDPEYARHVCAAGVPRDKNGSDGAGVFDDAREHPRLVPAPLEFEAEHAGGQDDGDVLIGRDDVQA